LFYYFRVEQISSQSSRKMEQTKVNKVTKLGRPDKK
jgi:hypothetical protein